VDRETAQRNISTGLRAAALAVGVFGLAFFAAVLYITS
jgi:hypothetical protein